MNYSTIRTVDRDKDGHQRNAHENIIEAQFPELGRELGIIVSRQGNSAPLEGVFAMTDAVPKVSRRRQSVAYACYLVVAVVLVFIVPLSAKIVAITGWLLAWAVLNTLSKNWAGCFGAWTSFLILLITVLASWVNNGTMSQSHVADCKHINLQMRTATRYLDDFHKQHGHYPDSLQSFPADDWRLMELKDPWGCPLQYRLEEDTFRLGSFGRDCVPGGVGLDTDWFCDSTTILDGRPYGFAPEISLPLWQFVFDTPSATRILIGAVPICLIAGHGVRKEARRTTPVKSSTVFMAVITTMIAAAVSTFLAMFYVAASQSSH